MHRAALITTPLAIIILLGSWSITLAESANAARDDLLYILGDNFFVVAGVLAVVLVIVQNPRSWTPDARISAGRWQWLAFTTVPFIPLLLVLFRQSSQRSFEILAALALGASIAVLLWSFRSAHRVESPPPRSVSVAMIALIALILIAGIVLRFSASGSSLLLWAIAPLLILVAPGLSLSAALLPKDAGYLEQALYAVPLSVTAQLIVILWMNLLGVTISTPIVFGVAGVLILGGLSVAVLRR